MQLLEGMLQNILKAEELNGISYKLGPFTRCSQCETEQLFSYVTYESGSKSETTSSTRQESLKCNGCQNDVTIKCNLETDEIIKSKV